jgi:hypothetical protein
MVSDRKKKKKGFDTGNNAESLIVKKIEDDAEEDIKEEPADEDIPSDESLIEDELNPDAEMDDEELEKIGREPDHPSGPAG